ncbi:Flp pilus assembly protein CpaB [Georgenia thermotolerans]|uniref:SAF domain-containing protein n=1 Tax=Georgenia thermotolerans TaxID=527326 RepID=A0A7J5UTE2_9MICO|nr:RcpC/CpaB family pilus assembly protein [Georgenia thermotolerans]KAE8765552.1 hypothetical protein GB883_03245 [Georgenia thermotolerans]
MIRRILAAVAAILLAAVGALVLVTYVGNADERAMAGMQTTDVLVVTAPVAQGTPVANLKDAVNLEALPAKAVPAGAVATLDDLVGQVTTADLQPGEQLLAARFADPATLQKHGAVEVPPNMHEVSVLLDPQRVVGGRVTAGDTVGVFVSLGGKTHLTLHKVLVTHVQGGVIVPSEGSAATDVAPAKATDPGAAATPEPAPSSSVMVTVAVSAPDAEKIVFAAESASIWLSKEGAEVPVDGTRIVTEGNVYE